MSEEVKTESAPAAAPSVQTTEDTNMTDAAEEKPSTSARENNGRPSKLNVIPRREDAPGTVLPEEDDEKADWDIATPQAEGVYSGMKAEDIEDLLGKAAKQGGSSRVDTRRTLTLVNFYFSDSNLPIDKYFFTLTACNSLGWVPLETVSSFKRMREFEAFGPEFITLALRRRIKEELKTNDVTLVLSKDGKFARRKRDLERNIGVLERSVYVKGFGDEEENTQEKIEQYFEQFGFKINSVRIRREDDPKLAEGNKRGKSKGSVFVEFTYKGDQEAFLEREEYPKFEGGSDEAMLVMSK